MKKIHTTILAMVLLLPFSAWAELPTARQIASKINIGWNLGNTLEATWVPRTTYLTTTQAAIDSVKKAGFNTVRLPAAWFYHSDTLTNTIHSTWLAHVKKIVDYCIKDSLYVILNAHWDNGWLENRINVKDSARVNVRQRAYWTQIATYFKDYDEHLLFAGANEPNAKDATGMAVLLAYHQTFIDAVRATGGNNASRTLVVQGPNTDIETTNNLMNTLPTDVIQNRLMVEVHYYTPWQFCLLDKDGTYSWEKMYYYWGKNNHSTTDAARNATWGEESDMDKYLNMMKVKFVDKGIPVLIGEFGAFRKKVLVPSSQELHNASIKSFYRYFVQSAISKGMITYCWDTGGIFNFSTGRTVDRDVLSAIQSGSADATTALTREKETELGVNAYPNPFQTALTLCFDKPNEIRNIDVFDLLGKQIEHVDCSDLPQVLDLGTHYQSGMYLLNVTSEKGSQTIKVIKKF